MSNERTPTLSIFSFVFRVIDQVTKDDDLIRVWPILLLSFPSGRGWKGGGIGRTTTLANGKTQKAERKIKSKGLLHAFRGLVSTIYLIIHHTDTHTVYSSRHDKHKQIIGRPSAESESS